MLSVVATAAATTGNAELRYFARSHEETVAERAAASRIERISASPDLVTTDTAAFALDDETARRLPGASSTESVTRVGPRLFRVETNVTWRASDGGDAHVRLATLLAREERR